MVSTRWWVLVGIPNSNKKYLFGAVAKPFTRIAHLSPLSPSCLQPHVHTHTGLPALGTLIMMLTKAEIIKAVSTPREELSQSPLSATEVYAVCIRDLGSTQLNTFEQHGARTHINSVCACNHRWYTMPHFLRSLKIRTSWQPSGIQKSQANGQ